jgi:integration host factor subunit alpha
MTVTKAHLTELIHQRLDLPRTRASHLVESLFSIMKERLESRDDVLISGFGKFCVKDKGRRRGRDPQTGEDLTLPERRVVTFKCSTVLKGKLNRKTS